MSERAQAVLDWIDNPRHEPLVTVPFPLVTGELAYLRVPPDLMRDEAQRMARALGAWTLPPEGKDS